MDKLKRSKDLLIAKAVDMKMKQQEMGTVFIDEVEYIQTVYIHRGTRLYSIDINSKQLKELEFTKKHTVLYVSSNDVNQYLLILFKNGRIFGYSKTKSIIYFQGLKSIPTKESIGSYRIFSNCSLTKLVILNNSVVTFWFKINHKIKEFNQNIKECSGESTSIDLAHERTNLINQGSNYNESFIALFDDNSNSGSFIKGYYFVIEEIKELKAIKAYLVEYLLRFDIDNHFHAIDDIIITNKSSDKEKDFDRRDIDEKHYEYKKYFNTKYVYTYLITSIEDNELSTENKQGVIIRESISGKMIVIGINLLNQNNAMIILFMCETYKFSSVKLANLFSSKKDKVFIEDIGLICKDLFIIVQFKNGLFTFLNQNLQVVNFYEGSHYITASRGLETLYILNYFENNKKEEEEHVSIIYSKTISNFFLFYSRLYLILFQCQYKNFENRMFLPSSLLFDDFILELKFTQTYMQLTENDQNNMLDNIHGFIFNHFNSIFKGEIEMSYGQNESLTNAIKFIINFIRIFRSLNLTKDANQTLLSYLLCISNDFFFYLLSLKELWLSFIFIRLCEKYLLKTFKLRNTINKINDDQVLKNQRSFVVLNPYYSISNPKLKCYNKVVNRLLHSKLRVLLMFFALIEFRNNQALNINVLYFLLAKLSVNKLIRKKLLDDVVSVLKILIRNWKFLKSENDKAGSEEFVLNDLTLNYRTEALASFLKPKIDRVDIKLNFFKCFYTFDELHNFTELNETYCRGDDEALINEYGYANNLGVIQKWILFFVNFFYNDMFNDIKGYIDNHVKQTISNDIRKQTENISPEEFDLSKIVYFNVYFSFMISSSFLEKLIVILSRSKEERFDDQLNKKLVSFISPVDVPYLIFEFGYIENDIERKITHNEIIANLSEITEGYFKEYNMTIQESLDYIEFIISNGFKHLISDSDTDMTLIQVIPIPKIQIYLYSSLVFYLISIVKVNGVALLLEKATMIHNAISSLNAIYKKGVYELVLLIFNGFVKYYLSMKYNKSINNNDVDSFKAVLVFINSIYTKILREEDDSVRGIVHEYIRLIPVLIQTPLIERTLYYEYKTMRTIVNAMIDDETDYSSIARSDNSQITFYNWLLYTYKRNSIQSTIDNIYSALFIQKDKEKETSLRYLMKINNINDIRKFILKNDKNTLSNIDEVYNRLIIQNSSYNSSYDQPSKFLIESTKSAFVKIIFLMQILYSKYLMATMNHKQSSITYMKLFSYLVIFEKDSIKRSNYFTCLIDYIKNINESTITNANDKDSLYELCINIHYVMIFNTEQRPQYDKCILAIKKTMKAFGSSFILKYDKFTVNDVNALVILNDRNDFTSIDNKLRKVLILYNNDTFISIIKQLIDSIIIVNNNRSHELNGNTNQITKEKFGVYHKAFCSLTGIPIDSRIVFRESFELTLNDELLNHITDTGNNCNSKKYLSYYSSEYEHILIEESNKETKEETKSKPQLQPKSKKVQSNNYDLDENDIIREETLTSNRISIVKITNNNNNDRNCDTKRRETKTKPIEIMIKSIQKHYFNKLLLGLFYRFKSHLTKKELGEITFMTIKPKEQTYDSIVIKEKYVRINIYKLTLLNSFIYS